MRNSRRRWRSTAQKIWPKWGKQHKEKKIQNYLSFIFFFSSIHIVSFTIRDISDDHNYLMSLGKKRTAEVMRDARIGEAEAERDASTRESEANLEKMSKTFDAETSIANSRRDFEMKKAAFDNEVNAEKAKAQMAGDLQKAKTRQEIKKEQMEVDVVGRKKQIEVDTHESKRKEKELEATIRKPALAERYRMEQQAEAERQAKITCADGSSKGAVSRGLAEASVIKSYASSRLLKRLIFVLLGWVRQRPSRWPSRPTHTNSTRLAPTSKCTSRSSRA